MVILKPFFKRKRWNVIKDLIINNDFNNICEVGVWKGYNALRLFRNVEGLNYVGIDSYDKDSYKTNQKDKQKLSNNEFLKAENIARNIIEKYNGSLIKTTSKEGSKLFKNGEFDIIFIDAEHTYKSVKEDIKLWLPKIKKGGILCGHDYCVKFFGVIKAVNEVLGVDNVSIEEDNVWVYKV